MEDGGLAELQARRRQAARRRTPLRHRLHRRGRAERLQHGLHHRPCSRRRSAARPGRRTARRRPRPSRSIPSGAVSVHVASVPQGQGHRTVAAQIVADALGLQPADIRVDRRDRHRARRLVDRVGQLLQPLRRRGRRRRASRRDAAEGQARAQRRGAAQRAGGRDRVRRRQDRRAAIPTTPSVRAGSRPPATGRRARVPEGATRRCARPCSGRRRS